MYIKRFAWMLVFITLHPIIVMLTPIPPVRRRIVKDWNKFSDDNYEYSDENSDEVNVVNDVKTTPTTLTTKSGKRFMEHLVLVTLLM